MSHWNHRFVRHKGAEGQPDWYAIHEVFYGLNDKPAMSAEPKAPYSDNDDSPNAKESMRWTLNKMLQALDKPALDFDTKEEIADEAGTVRSRFDG